MKCTYCKTGHIDILDALRKNERFTHLRMGLFCTCGDCGARLALSFDNGEVCLAELLGFPGPSFELLPETKIKIDGKWIVEAYEVHYQGTTFVLPWNK